MLSRAVGLADEELERFRRSLIDETRRRAWFSAPGARPSASRHTSSRRARSRSTSGARASLLIGELARFFRSVLWQTAGLVPPCPDPADRRAAEILAHRLEPEDVLVAADRCVEADYYLARRVYLPMILSSLVHDLGKVINPR